MLRFKLLIGFAVLLCAQVMPAQIVSPVEMQEIGPQRLQAKYLPQLKGTAAAIAEHKFPYHLYFSRLLDIDESKQVKLPQRSIRFDKYEGETVLEMTCNYFASYSAEQMNINDRAKRTFLDVMLPLLQAAVPQFRGNDAFAAYAIEVSHHVRSKVMGVSAENAENVAIVLPREAAERLVAAKTPEEQQAALLEGKMFVDAEPFNIWVWGDTPPSQPVVADKDDKDADDAKPVRGRHKNTVEVASLKGAAVPEPTVSSRLVQAPAWPVRLIGPDTLAHLKSANGLAVDKLVKDLDGQAHFVPYAPPSFIAFHQGAYLQLNVTTTLDAPASTSQYKLAALAFDQHISHLLRPLLAYFPTVQDFDGFDISTTVKLPDSEKSEAVEFFLPFSSLRCFAAYDCTGQQVINSSFVLINGERAQVDLETAEAK